MKDIIGAHYKKAKEEGRVCEICGWMITIPNWKKGDRVCADHKDALRGVNVRGGHGRYRDEPVDRTGDAW